MKYAIRRILALLTTVMMLFSLLALSGCSLDELLEERQLNQALDALDDGDYDDLLDCLKENRDLTKNKDLVNAIKKHIRQLSSDFEDGDLDADDVEEILDEMEDVLDRMDNETLWEKAEELREAISSRGISTGGHAPTAPQPAETPEIAAPANDMTVAIIPDSSHPYDGGYNQICLHAAENWCASKGVPYYLYVPASSYTDDLYVSILYAIADGCNTIVLPGYFFGSILAELQYQYPDVYFLAIDLSANDLTPDYVNYYDPAYNTACVTFAEEQAGYLAGYTAVKEGYTKLGFLGGMAVPAIVRYGYGFLQGADAAAAEMGITIDMNYAYCGQYYGSAAITEQMMEWYVSGTEIIFACGGSIHTSVVEAAHVYGGHVIGMDVDQSFYSSQIVTSATKNLQLAIETLLDAAYYDYWYQYGGQETIFSLADGAYVGLPTDTWSFQTFRLSQYQDLVDRIAYGHVTVSADVSDFPPLHATNLYYYN